MTPLRRRMLEDLQIRNHALWRDDRAPRHRAKTALPYATPTA